jgi:hypothetical protein
MTNAWREYFWNQDDRYWNFKFFILFFNILFITGQLALFIFTIRLREWSSYSKLKKVVIIALLTEFILTGPIRRIISNCQMLIERDFNLIFSTDPFPWFLRISVTGIFFSTVDKLSVYEFVPEIILFAFIFISNITLKTPARDKKVLLSKWIWVFFALVEIIQSTLTLLSDLYLDREDFSTTEWLYLTNIQTYGHVFAMILIMLLIIYSPEALLLTEYQILRAENLYSYVNNLPSSEIHSFLSFDARLIDYIESLPMEIIAES